MRLEVLLKRYLRLQHEVSVAYERKPWPCALIDQLTERVSRTEQEIAAVARSSRNSQPFPGVEYLNLSMVARQADSFE